MVRAGNSEKGKSVQRPEPQEGTDHKRNREGQVSKGNV